VLITISLDIVLDYYKLPESYDCLRQRPLCQLLIFQ